MKVASLEIELLANIARLQNDMGRATRTVDGAMQRIERSTAMAMKALGGLAAAFSVRAIAQQVTSITKLASRYNELGIVMNTVGRNAGYTRGELAQLEVDLKKTGISALESRSNIAKLVAANIDLSKATELARLAQDAAVIGGLNSSDAFARLTSGIQSAQVETLRTMGLNANFQKSYEDLAAELGKTTKELTELEKTQARTNAVLALAPTVAGAYEASMTNAGKALRSAERYAEDLQVALGEAFQPAFVVAVDAYSNALKSAIDNVDLLKRSMIALTLSTLPLLVAGLTKLAVTVIPVLTARMWSLTAAMLSTPITAIPTLISMAIAAYVMFDEKLEGTHDFFVKTGEVWQIIFDDVKKVTDELKKEVVELWGAFKDLTGDTSPKTWTDMLIVGLARVADVAALVARTVGAMVTVIQAIIKSAQYMAAFVARPNALSRKFAPEESARLEQEYQDALKASVAATKKAAEQIAGLWTEPANKYEQAALRIVNTQRVVTEEVALVDLTVKKATETISDSTTELGKNSKALSEAQKAAEAFAKARQDSFRNHRNEISNIHQQAQALEDQVAVFGQGERALEKLAIARLEEQKTVLAGFAGSEEQISLIEQEIAARERLMEAGLTLDKLEEQKKFHDEALDDWKRTVDEYGRVFRDGFAAMLNRGKEGWKSFTRSLVTTFKTTVADAIYRMFAQPIVVKLVASIGGAFGVSGIANAFDGGAGTLSSAMGLGNIASGLKGAWSAITGGFTALGDSVAFAAQEMGAWLVNNTTGILNSAGATLMQSAGMLGTAASYLSGAAAGWGLGNVISGQYAAVGGNKNIATGAGTIIGSVVGGPIGGAIGGIIGGAVNRLFGRGPKEYTNDYLDLVFSDAGLEASIEHRWRQKGGALRSGREGSDWEGLGPGDAMYDELAGIFDAGAQRAMAAARMLGFDASLAGFGFAPGLVHLNQDDQELMQQQLQERILATLNEAAVHLTDGALWGIEKEGELYVDMMMRIADALATVNPMLDLLGLNLIEVSGYGGHMASQLLELMGGAEAAMQSMEFYYQNFYSEQERIAKTTEQLTDVFAQFGLTLPRSHAEFRQLVEALDLTTDRGNVLFATLMAIAPAFDQIATYAQGAAGVMMDSFAKVEALANRLSKTLQAIQIGGALTDRLAGLLGRSPVFGQRREAELWAAMGGATPEQQIEMAGQLTDLVLARYQLEQDAQRKQADSIREQLTSITRMRDLAKGLQDYLRSLESSSLAPYSLAEKIGIAETDLQRLVSAAQAGDERAMSQVQGALQNALQLWRDYGASGAEYQAAYERLTGMAGGLADSVYSVSERQARSLERQVDQLDQANGFSKAQLAELAQIYDIAMAATLALEEQYALDAQALAEEMSELERIGLDTARLHDIADLMQGLPAQIGALINSSLSVAGQAALQEVTSGPIGGSTVIGGIAGIVAGGLTGNTKGETYFLNNPDVATAYAVDSQGMSVEGFAKWHFDTYGQYEGRSYAVGTSRVPHDMLANIHKDEMVIDARSSDVLRRYGISIGDGQVVREIRALRAEVVELREQNARIGARLVDATRQTSGDIETAITRRERDDLVVTKSRRHGVLA